MSFFSSLLSFFSNLFTIGLDRYSFRTARIATVLAPRLIKGITEKSTVSIIGGDCANAQGDPSSDSTYPRLWLEELEKLAAHCEGVEYVLVEPSERAWENLRSLHAARDGRLKLYRITNIDDIKDEEKRRLASECRTSHFTLADKPRQIWIEGYHPAGSVEAQYCEFIPLGSADRDPRYEGLKARFEVLKSVAMSS